MKHLYATLLLVPWFLPLAALGRPAHRVSRSPTGLRVQRGPISRLQRRRPSGGHPGAVATLLLPLTGTVQGADGTLYVISGAVTLTVTGAPPPPPPPPPPTVNLSYLTMSPAAVTAGQSATVTVVLSGVVPAGQAANVLLTSADAGVHVPGLLTIPAGADHGGANVTTTVGVTTKKLVAITADYNGRSAYSNLRVQPDFVPPPPPPPPPPAATADPNIVSYANGDGSPIMGPLVYGQQVLIAGSAFGTAPGKVYWQGGPVSILLWTDTLIRVQLPVPVFKGGSEFTLQRQDGTWFDTLIPADGPNPVPGSAGRR